MAAPPLPQRRLHTMEPCQRVVLLSDPAIHRLGSFHRANVAASANVVNGCLPTKATPLFRPIPNANLFSYRAYFKTR